MEKLKMQSENLVNENIGKIAELFPNCVTEGYDNNGKLIKMVDFDLLKQELSYIVVEGNDERYTMTWPGKKQSILTANSPINATFRPCKEESVDFDNTQNLYIEGDNLDVLKLLRETYLNKIKMIYIDPPYNTGNDFVYEDDFATSAEEYLQASKSYDEQGNKLFQNNDSNGRFHSDWLSMIYSRLKLARDLLTDDGVIFISIDDNEVENLKKIGNEIFGENNFVGQWNWFKSATPPNLSYKIKKNIEYLLAYEKTKDNVRYEGLLKSSPSNDPFTKPQNTYKELKFPVGTITTVLPDGIYKKGKYGTDKFPNELRNDLIVENGKNKNEVIFYNRFIWVQETLDENLRSGLRVDLSKQLVLSYKRTNYNPECPPNLIDSSVLVDTTEQAGAYLDNIFDGNHVFDYPKPVSLLKYILKFKNDNNAIILDFFSGSATTAHAVMQLNAEDGGTRKYICVQLPEICDEKSEAYKAGYKNICEIGKERIRRAGKKIKEQLEHYGEERKIPGKTLIGAGASPFDRHAEYKDNITDEIYTESRNCHDIKDRYKYYPEELDTGFRVLKLDSSCMKDIYYNPEDITQDLLTGLEDNIKEDRTPEDLLFQVMLDMGVLLSSKIEEKLINNKKVFIVGEYDNDSQPNLICCFDNDLTDDVVKEIAKMKPLYAVFRDSSIATDSVSVNFEQIFETYSPTTKRRVI